MATKLHMEMEFPFEQNDLMITMLSPFPVVLVLLFACAFQSSIHKIVHIGPHGSQSVMLSMHGDLYNKT